MTKKICEIFFIVSGLCALLEPVEKIRIGNRNSDNGAEDTRLPVVRVPVAFQAKGPLPQEIVLVKSSVEAQL